MKKENFLKRKLRVRAKVHGTKVRPRLSVFRSNSFLYAQVIDDEKGTTLTAVSTKEEMFKDKKGMEKAILAGEEIAKRAKGKKIKKVVFDKSGYKYHGQIKALAEGARKGGLEF
jgi:large subunit ribosomal protein L18